MQNFSMPHLLWHKVRDIHNCCRVFGGSRILFNDLHVHVSTVQSYVATFHMRGKGSNKLRHLCSISIVLRPFEDFFIHIYKDNRLLNLDLYLLRRLNGLFDKAGISMILMEKYSLYILNSRYNIIIYTLHRCTKQPFRSLCHIFFNIMIEF